MIQQLAPVLGLNATFLNLTEAEYTELMSRPSFVTSDTSTAAPVSMVVQDLLDPNNTEVTTEVLSEEVTSQDVTSQEVTSQKMTSQEVTIQEETSQEVTTLAENVRESKILNEELTTGAPTENSNITSDGNVGKEVTESPATPVESVEVNTEVTLVPTEANTASPDLGSVLSSLDLLNSAIFTDYEPESEVFQRIPSLDEVVLTCDVLTASGDSAAVISGVNIRAMESKDLMNCLETLGRLPWTKSGRGAVWQALKSKLNLFSDSELRPIKREMMLQLHNLLPAVVSADPDLIDVTEDNIDGLSVIGK